MTTSKHDEIIQIVDKHNRKIGHQPRSVMLAEKLIPRASYVLVFNDREEIFLQKRTATKDIYPGHWDVAAGGVVLADESYEESAQRELEEELGVHGVPLHFLFDHYYDAGGNRVWGRVFACLYNGPFILQESEVAAGRFISVKNALLLKDREPFSPNGLEILYKLQRYRQKPQSEIFFLHGLDSSGQGTKGRFFAEHFPHVHCPDFHGTLAERLDQLTALCRDLPRVVFIGSSFGGLMATCYAAGFPEKVTRLILLAPALNYGEYRPPQEKLQVPATLIIGNDDTVTPPAKVIPLAEQSFAQLTIHRVDDDHMLHGTFMAMAWHELLMD
ncbi:MAG: alpha/beta fold hydrolase [Desulforhopalus sp.]|nr:alpha/beta fold hydrolase [Desulforhopalus sp.]